MRRIITVKFIQDTRPNHGFSGAPQNPFDLSSKEYSYFTDDDALVPGDWTVVMVNNTPRVVVIHQVEGLSLDQINKAGKWIVCRIDLVEYHAKMAREVMIKEIQNTLDKELQAYNRLAIMQQAARTNPRVAQLLGQLADLDPSVKQLLETQETKTLESAEPFKVE